jgi:hypothetical protein
MEKTMKTQTSIIVLITALAGCLLMTSCDGENLIPDNETGVMVSPSVRLSGFIDGGNQEITRSQSAEQEPVRTAIPLGDGMLLEMSLEQDSRSSLRTDIDFPNGTKVQVIAVNHSTKAYVSHGNFSIAGNSLLTDNIFWVPQGSTCDFICISYNSTTIAPPTPTYHPSTKQLNDLSVQNALNNNLSLLYGKIEGVYIDTSAPILDFQLLKQKLAKVKLVIDGSYNEWTITSINNASSIYLTPSYSAYMAYNTGVLTASSSQQMSFDWSSSSPAQTRTSNERTIVPNGSTPLTVFFLKNALTVNTSIHVPTNSISEATFPSTVSLEAGNTYTLRIIIKTPIFAKSNIYWDNNQLTFDKTSPGNESYQGVFFKWGSLVGISPTGKNNRTTHYFIPPRPSNNTWTKILVMDASDAGVPTDWENGDIHVPFCGDDTDSYKNHSAKNYLYDTYPGPYNHTTQNYVGDICNYLDPAWRLPYQAEFGLAMENWNTTFSPSIITPDSLIATHVDGKFDIGTKGISIKASGAFFPASGDRWLLVGVQGHYWSGTPVKSYSFQDEPPVKGTDKTYVLSFMNTSLNLHDIGLLKHPRTNPRPVRCVKI